MKKLGIILIVGVLAALFAQAPVSSEPDQVLCCYYCKPCKEQRCEMQSSLDCVDNEGTPVEDCSRCRAGKR